MPYRSGKDEPKQTGFRRGVTINAAVLVAVIALVFLAGAIAGMQVMPFLLQDDSGPGLLGLGALEFKYTRPVTAPLPGKGGALRELKPFRYAVKSLVDERLRRGDASAAGVYFRDLAAGTWFGVNEREPLAPQDLLAVPVMMAYFKWAETSPLILRRAIPYDRGDQGGETAPSHRPLEPGRSYTLDELIFRMIVQGDRTALAVLREHLPGEKLERVYHDLSPDRDPAHNEDWLTLNGYAPFLRVLYSASYLERDTSERALDYLVQATYRSGLRSGVPKAVDVAGSFGAAEAEAPGRGEERSVHEIGIVYLPGRPYLLGIVARGTDEPKLEGLIRDISSLVYREVEQQTK